MWGWFGGRAAQQRQDAPKKAILDLRTQLDMLQKREKHLENQIADQEKVARANVQKNKNAARTALKRKKQYETTLEQTSNQITMLENQIYAIEAANINQETLSAMKNAGDAMKVIHGKNTIDKVDQIMEDLADQRALADEIGQAIAAPGLPDTVDEDEIRDELEQLEQEALDTQMLKTGTIPVLPSPARAEPASKNKAAEAEEDDEDAELAKLQAEMAI